MREVKEKKPKKKKAEEVAEEPKKRGRKKKEPAKVNLNVRVRRTAKKEIDENPLEDSIDDVSEEIIYEQPKVVRARIVREEEYRRKDLHILIGVSVTMVLLVFVWAINLKRQFKVAEMKGGESTDDWQKMADDFSKRMEEMKEDLDKVKEYNEQAKRGVAGPDSTVAGTTTQEELLAELKESISSTTDLKAASVLAPEAVVAPTSSIEELKNILESKQ